MASGKLKDKQCVYCVSAPAITSDHVIAKGFFLKDRRDDLPQAPACKQCNGEKSKLEEYLMTVFPFGARHSDATENLRTMVPPRLANNAKRDAELTKAFEESGGATLPIDYTRLNRLFTMIATGLVWSNWKVLLGPGFSATAGTFHDSGWDFFRQMIAKWNTPKHVVENLGNGTFSYEGFEATDVPQMTIWRFSLYGPVVLVGDPKMPGPVSLFVAVTGPDAIIKNLHTHIAA